MLLELSPDLLVAHPLNSAIYGDEDVSELVAMISENNWVKPLTVCADTQEGRFQIISGHRRWKAAKALNLDKLPCQVLEFESEENKLQILLLENQSREKTREQRIRETEAYKTLESWLAAKRKVAKESGLSTRTRDILATQAAFGSGWNYTKAVKVVEGIDRYTAAKRFDDADRLRKLLNISSVESAFIELEKIENQDNPKPPKLQREDKPPFKNATKDQVLPTIDHDDEIEIEEADNFKYQVGERVFGVLRDELGTIIDVKTVPNGDVVQNYYTVKWDYAQNTSDELPSKLRPRKDNCFVVGAVVLHRGWGYGQITKSNSANFFVQFFGCGIKGSFQDSFKLKEKDLIEEQKYTWSEAVNFESAEFDPISDKLFAFVEIYDFAVGTKFKLDETKMVPSKLLRDHKDVVFSLFNTNGNVMTLINDLADQTPFYCPIFWLKTLEDVVNKPEIEIVNQGTKMIAQEEQENDNHDEEPAGFTNSEILNILMKIEADELEKIGDMFALKDPFRAYWLAQGLNRNKKN